MYHGEVNVAQDDLNSFLQVAEDLKVKGRQPTSKNSSGFCRPLVQYWYRYRPSVKISVVDPEGFIPDPDPATNFY